MTENSIDGNSMSNDVMKQVFINLHQRLVESMNATLVIDALFSKKVLHSREAAQLHLIQSPDDRCRRLLFLLHASGHPEAFLHLYRVLKEDVAAKWLMEEVDEIYKSLSNVAFIEDQQLLDAVTSARGSNCLVTILRPKQGALLTNFDVRPDIITKRSTVENENDVNVCCFGMQTKCEKNISQLHRQDSVVLDCTRRRLAIDSSKANAEPYPDAESLKEAIEQRDIKLKQLTEENCRLNRDHYTALQRAKNCVALLATIDRLSCIHSLNGGKPVRGLTTLNNELYVRYEDVYSKDITVYDTETYGFLRHLQMPRLGLVSDMTSCKRHQCIYIADNMHNVVHKLSDEDKLTHWPINDVPRGMSISSGGNVLVTCCDVGRIKEFDTDGQLIREIVLQSDVVYPWHAIELTTSEYVVCHGRVKDPLHRVCIVDSQGCVVRSYGGFRGSANGQMNTPVRLALNGFIIVAECMNKRVQILSPTLNYVREIITDMSGKPSRIWFDEDACKLYIADNVWDSCEYVSGQVNVYSL